MNNKSQLNFNDAIKKMVCCLQMVQWLEFLMLLTVQAARHPTYILAVVVPTATCVPVAGILAILYLLKKMGSLLIVIFDKYLGLVFKRPNDYDVRCGQTNQQTPVRPIQVLHCLLQPQIILRIFVFIQWLVFRNGQNQNMIYLLKFLKLPRKSFNILTETGERWNFVDSTGDN